MKKAVFAAALAFASFAANGVGYASVNFISAGVSVGASAWASSDGVSVDSHIGHSSGQATNFADLLAGLSVSAHASAYSGVSTQSAASDSVNAVTIKATSPGVGYIEFVGSASASLGSEVAGGFAGASNAQSLAFYIFSVTSAPYPFVVNYETSGSNDAVFSYDAFLLAPSSLVDYIPVGDNDAGMASYTLDPGYYLFGILQFQGAHSGDSVLATDPGSTLNGESLARFDFNAAVPETSTWVMLGLGLTAVGIVAAKRRRNGASSEVGLSEA